MPTYRLVESSSVATRVLVGFKMCFLNVLRLHVSQSQRQKRLYKQYMEQLAGAYVERYKGAELKPRWDQRYGYDAVPVPGDWRYSMSCGCDSETEGTGSCRSCCCSEWSGSGHCSMNSEPCCSEVIFNGGQHFSGKIAAQHACHQLPICYPGEFGDRKTSDNTAKEVENKYIRVIDVTDSEEELSSLLKTLNDKQQTVRTSKTSTLPPPEEVSYENRTLDTNKDKNPILKISKNYKSEKSKQETGEHNLRGPPPRPMTYNKMSLDHCRNDGRVQYCSRKLIIQRSSEESPQRFQNKSMSIQESSGTEKKHKNSKVSRSQSNTKEKKIRKARFRKKISIQSSGTDTENIIAFKRKASLPQSGTGTKPDLKKPNQQKAEVKRQSIALKLLKSPAEWKGAKHFRILSKSRKKSPASNKLNHLPIEVKTFDNVSPKSTKSNHFSTGSSTSSRTSAESEKLNRTPARSMTPNTLSTVLKVLSRPSTGCMMPHSPSEKLNEPNNHTIESVSSKSQCHQESRTDTTPNGLSADSKVLSHPSTRSITISADSNMLSHPSTRSMTLSAYSKMLSCTSTRCKTPFSLFAEQNKPSRHFAESMSPNRITVNSKAEEATTSNAFCADSKMLNRPSTEYMTPCTLSAESKAGTKTLDGRSGDSIVTTRPSTRSLTPHSLSAESKAGTITPNGRSVDSKAKSITLNWHSGDSMAMSRPSTRSGTPYSVSSDFKAGIMTPSSLSAYSSGKVRSYPVSIKPNSRSMESKAGTITPNDLSFDSNVLSRLSTESTTSYSFLEESNVLIRSLTGSTTPNRLSAGSVILSRLSTELEALERLSDELDNFSESLSDSQLSYVSQTMSTESKLNQQSDNSKTLLPLSSTHDSSGDETLTLQSSFNDGNTRPTDPTRDYSDYSNSDRVEIKNEVTGSEQNKRQDVLRLSEYSEDSFATEVSTSIGLDTSEKINIQNTRGNCNTL